MLKKEVQSKKYIKFLALLMFVCYGLIRDSMRLFMTLLYEGKSKQILSSDNDNHVLIKFKNTVTALSEGKEDVFENKARVTSSINKYCFNLIKNSIPTHIVSFNNDSSFVAKKLTMIPVKIIIRNFAAGSICERKNYNEGEWFPYPLLEYFLENDEFSSPFITEDYIVDNNILNFDQIDVLIDFSRRANQILWTDFLSKNLRLVDVKFEFGRDSEGYIYLADEISPDTFRVWDSETGESLGKDVYRENKANLVQTYSKLADRLEIKL